MRRLTQEEVLRRFKAAHGDRYDYSRTLYRTGSRKVIVCCRLHGEFQQEARSHERGAGCPVCHYDKLRK